jgi:C-terminal processing protease CtpA/Prc
MRVRIPEARVIEVWEGASAGRAGVLPGDVIATDVQQLALPASRVVIEVPILRNKRRLTVRLDTRMMEGQRDLAAAGILPADRIVSVNGQPVAGRAEADRLLSRVSSAFLVVQRGERLFGVNVER